MRPPCSLPLTEATMSPPSRPPSTPILRAPSYDLTNIHPASPLDHLDGVHCNLEHGGVPFFRLLPQLSLMLRLGWPRPWASPLTPLIWQLLSSLRPSNLVGLRSCRFASLNLATSPSLVFPTPIQRGPDDQHHSSSPYAAAPITMLLLL